LNAATFKNIYLEINDLLHQSAYKNGLSQSLYAPEAFVNNINESTVFFIRYVSFFLLIF
jgi:hypothetical protein